MGRVVSSAYESGLAAKHGVGQPLGPGHTGELQEQPDLECDFPYTVQALLWPCCSQDDFGMLEVSPLCEALRSRDDVAVLLLLQHRASPSRREEGSNDPTFVAIQMSSAENVHLDSCDDVLR